MCACRAIPISKPKSRGTNRIVSSPKAEPLISAYYSLQGVDGIYFFAAGSGNWENNGGGNWTYMMPGEIGQSPAEALQYRRGDLKPGDTVIRQVTTVDDVLNLKSSTLLEGAQRRFSHHRSAEFRLRPIKLASFDPLSFFVGRVERTLRSQGRARGRRPEQVHRPRQKDHHQQHGRNRLGLSGRDFSPSTRPRSQAVVGFLSKAGPIKLGDVTIDPTTIWHSPRHQPRRPASRHFEENPRPGLHRGKNVRLLAANGVIQDIGRPPIIVRDIDANVTLPGNASLKATALDEQGYPRNALHAADHRPQRHDHAAQRFALHHPHATLT